MDLDAEPTPAIVHWGEELEDSSPESLASLAVAARPQRVSGGLDRTPRLTLMSTPAGGWLNTPGLEGHRDGAGFSARFEVAGVQANDHRALLSLSDSEARLAAQLELRVGPTGLFHQRLTLRNTADTPYTVQSMLLTFPVPWDATELLDTTGRHLRERTPQRRAFTYGTHLRESRRGRPGADATLLLAAGRPGFGFETGRVHGIHVAWSGNHRVLAERVTTGEAFLAGGELLGPGEVILAPGESTQTPWVIGSWGDGLTELSHRFHGEWRQRPRHPRRPRPVTLNTWEAVYFDHTLEKLTALADAAADVGVERFVLDDGWFTGRRDDTAGLGDWFVDDAVWPQGLHPLVDHVTALGMEFGLWVEPEMVNPDSDLARAHPDWILRGRMSLPPAARQQQVLDLAHPEAYAYVAGRLHALLDEYPIAYLKWDHNRDLVDAGTGPGGVARVREQTLAVYRLLDELKSARPGLEIESCASGGARVDLGILDRTDRIWTSDSLDPIERLANQRYTALVVPPELMGMHLTSPVVHSSGRTVALGFSAAVALFGHFGVEWDLTTVDDRDPRGDRRMGLARQATAAPHRHGTHGRRRRDRPGDRRARNGRPRRVVGGLHDHAGRDDDRLPRRTDPPAGTRSRPHLPPARPRARRRGRRRRSIPSRVDAASHRLDRPAARRHRHPPPRPAPPAVHRPRAHRSSPEIPRTSARRRRCHPEPEPAPAGSPHWRQQP